MAEYIERDEAIRKTLEACVKIVGHGISQIDAADIVDIMESIPTADVVEVVRCKDCKYFNTESWHFNWCEAHSYDELIKCKENDFCSYGERKCDNGKQ